MKTHLRASSFVILTAFLAFPLTGQRVPVEIFLLPLDADYTTGAHGSRWRTERTIRNDGPEPVRRHLFPCGIGICDYDLLAGFTSRVAPLPEREQLSDRPPLYAVWLIEKSTAHQLHVSLVTREVALRADNPGTEIPVVREHELRRERLQLLNVPMDIAYRRSLRLYIFPGAEYGDSPGAGMTLSIRLFDLDAEEFPGQQRLLGETTYVVPTIVGVDYGLHAMQSIDLDRDFPGALIARRVRVEIENVGGEGRFWAFISVTSNSTQQFRTVTPQ